MKKAVIFYFSGTGNTWWVAQKIGRKLRESDMKVKTVSIEKVTIDEASKLIEVSDLVGFGYPMYCADMPQNMKAFLEQLERYPHKKGFAFCTQDSFSGDGTRLVTDYVKHTDIAIHYTMHIHMPSNSIKSVFPLSNKFSPKEQNDSLRKADKQIDKFVYYILEDIQGNVGFNKIAKVMGSVQRIPYRKMRKKEKHMIGFSTKCTHCGYCEKICPVDNITITPNGNITYNKCIQCLRCYNYCPHTAVKLYGREHDEKRSTVYKGPTRHFDPKILKE